MRMLDGVGLHGDGVGLHGDGASCLVRLQAVYMLIHIFLNVVYTNWNFHLIRLNSISNHQFREFHLFSVLMENQCP